MKAAPFDSTPKFQHFKDVRRGVLAVPKKRLDQLVRVANENSPRNGDPGAPEAQKEKKAKVIATSPKDRVGVSQRLIVRPLTCTTFFGQHTYSVD